MGTPRLIAFTLAFAVMGAPGTPRAQLQPLATPVRTIFLDGGAEAFSVPSSVAYHPAFDRYYASDTGTTAGPGFVFGPTGGMPQQTQNPLNIDPRAWNFNLNTGFLELVTFNAVTGGAGQGLIEAGVDASGMLTGGTSTLLMSMPGNSGSQTSPAYDPVADVFYSRSSGNTVNIVRRSDGTLRGTIVLDFTTAGIATVFDDGIVFVPEPQWLGVLDDASDSAAFFDLGGNFVGASALDITLNSAARRPGYANGQLFAFDTARNGWQGYRIVDIGCVADSDCDDSNLCTDDACDANFHCVNANNAVPCNDGNSCSVNDACSQGSCVGSVAGFEGFGCLLHRLKVPDLCPDGLPVSLRRFILKRLGKAQGFADRAESEGNAQFLAKARIALDPIATKADAAAAAKSAKKRISATCAATIRARVEESTSLLGALP